MRLVIALLIWSLLSPWYIRSDGGSAISHVGLDITAAVHVPLLAIPLRRPTQLQPKDLKAALATIMRTEAPWLRIVFPEVGGETAATLPGRRVPHRAVVRHVVRPLTLPGAAIIEPTSTIKKIGPSGLLLNLSRFSFANIASRPSRKAKERQRQRRLLHDLGYAYPPDDTEDILLGKKKSPPANALESRLTLALWNASLHRAEQPLTTTSFNGAGAGGTVEPVTRVPVFANTWYVRTDGGSTSRCTGHADAPDPGSGTAQPCAYSSLQNGLDAVVAGDTVSVRAGDTFDGTFTVPNKSCSAGSPCTIKSSALALLPAGRVAPANASNMPRIRSLGGGNNGAAFQLAANADYWTIDGFELTDNAATSAFIGMLVDATDNTVDHLTVQHCYFHQKETGTNYNRTTQRGIQFEGDTLLFKWNYLYIIGYSYDRGFLCATHCNMDTTAVLTVGDSKNITIEDNYLSTWWNILFTGGADSPPQNSANLSSATTGSATFDNVTGLTPGVMLRLEFTTVGTFSTAGFKDSCDGTFPAGGDLSTGTQIVRSSGFALSSADTFRYGTMKNAVDSYSLLIGLCAVSGNNYTIAKTRSTLVPTPGTVTMTIYETALVTSVVGSTVNYTAYGVNSLASSGATKASWNYGDQGLISDMIVRKNTFYVDPAYANDAYLTTGNSPKGLFELKNINRLTFEGNYVLGYPAILAIYPGNQYGTSPWTTARGIIIRNNWIAPDLGYPESTRDALSLFDASNYATVAPRGNYQVYNNFVKNTSNFYTTKTTDNVTVTHNTVLNCVGCTSHGNTDVINGANAGSTNFTFSNNIVGYSAYGIQCQVGAQSVCFPGAVFQNNAVVQNDTFNSGTIHCGASSEWAPGAALCPVVTSYNSVGFTNLAGDIYSLTIGSSYHNGATDGTDPGVDWAALLTALGGSVPSSAVRRVFGGKIIRTGKITP